MVFARHGTVSPDITSDTPCSTVSVCVLFDVDSTTGVQLLAQSSQGQ